MKTTLQFNDEEQHEAKCAIHASDLYCGLWNAQDSIRRLLKYREDLGFTEAQEDAVWQVMSDIQEKIDICE